MGKKITQWVCCAKCGKLDESIGYHVGTRQVMKCTDCGDPHAKLCRKCCPTGHGTVYNVESWS